MDHMFGTAPSAIREQRPGEPGASRRANAALGAIAAALAVVLAASIDACAAMRDASPVPPLRWLDLTGWKLQVPGPRDVYAVSSYRSRYFQVDADGDLRFRVDCSETGYTANAHYVRSELRHLPEWSVMGRAKMAATIRVESQAVPDKVTVLQIHGIAPSGADAPPLLRVALDGADLFAFLKADAEGVRTEKILLAPGAGRSWFRCSLAVNSGGLAVDVDGVRRLTRDVSYWPYLNYFKAGAYPQANEGSVEVTLRSLAANAAPSVSSPTRRDGASGP